MVKLPKEQHEDQNEQWKCFQSSPFDQIHVYLYNIIFFFILCDGGDFFKQIEDWIYVVVGCKSSQSSQMDHWPTFEVLVWVALASFPATIKSCDFLKKIICLRCPHFF